MLEFIKRHKTISGLICANIIAIIVVIVVIIVHNAKTATIDINVAPADATITLNGARYDNFKQHDILPGDYHVRITMDGMQPKEYDISLENNGFARIWNYLLSEDGSFDYYLTHPDDELILAEVAPEDDEAAQAFIDSYNKKASLIDVLPIEYAHFTDDFAYYTQYSIELDFDKEDCARVLCLLIKDNTGGNEQSARNKIKEYGYDPADYEITYEYLPLQGSRSDDE